MLEERPHARRNPMKTTPQKFCASSAADAKWAQGLRKFFEYRDLGISEATGGAYSAHVIRVKKPVTDFPHTGPHVHDLEFQMKSIWENPFLSTRNLYFRGSGVDTPQVYKRL